MWWMAFPGKLDPSSGEYPNLGDNLYRNNVYSLYKFSLSMTVTNTRLSRSSLSLQNRLVNRHSLKSYFCKLALLISCRNSLDGLAYRYGRGSRKSINDTLYRHAVLVFSYI